jgi:hypothetical protein
MKDFDTLLAEYVEGKLDEKELLSTLQSNYDKIKEVHTLTRNIGLKFYLKKLANNIVHLKKELKP